jgi:uncharacterized membrane protein YgdD (TMEM256/DUF423 family)
VIRWIVLLAGIVGAAGVSLGAFSAHGLDKKLVADGYSADVVLKKLNTCEIAVRYHLIHAVALLALAAPPAVFAPRRRGLAALLLLAGLGMFCGTLYAQAILGLVGYNWVVPLGGGCFILGWLTIALAAFTATPNPAADARRASV